MTAKRHYVAASTGIEAGRPPTKAERLQLWLRQARGVFDVTAAARLRDGARVRQVRRAIIVQSLLVGAWMGAMWFAPQPVPIWLGTVFTGLTCVLFCLAQLTAFGAMMQDAIEEVRARSARSFRATPLGAGAFLAGKTTYYASVQATASALMLPSVAACGLLGSVGPFPFLLMLVVPMLWTLAFGALVIGATADAHDQQSKSLTKDGMGLAMFRMAQAARASGQGAAQLAMIPTVLTIVGAIR
jgi:hypothetical protein